MRFDWDDRKAETNLTKHGVSFQEAASVFNDPLSIAFPDPDHSIEEKRLVIIGHSHQGRLLFVSHTDQDNQVRVISAREVTRREKRVYEEALCKDEKKDEPLAKPASVEDELRPEYDAELLKALLHNGVRGKYVERCREGTNLVKLAPDVAAAFPTEQAVNEALRSLLERNTVAA